MIDGVLMVFPCGYNVHRLVNYIFWGGVATKSPPLAEQTEGLRVRIGDEGAALAEQTKGLRVRVGDEVAALSLSKSIDLRVRAARISIIIE